MGTLGVVRRRDAPRRRCSCCSNRADDIEGSDDALMAAGHDPSWRSWSSGIPARPTRRRRPGPDDRRGRDRHPRRPVGLREDHDAQDDQPDHRADLGPDHPRRRGRDHADPDQLRRAASATSSSRSGCSPTRPSARNIATVPRLLGWDGGSTARVDELLDLVGMDPADLPRPLPQGALRRAAPAGRGRPRAGRRPAVMLMDEPFGAVDPISRDRLQNEFLRLQERDPQDHRVRHPRHRRGDQDGRPDRDPRASGRRIAQYDTPEAVLAGPADDFVREFIGSGAALKRLGLTRVRDVELAPWPTSAVGAGREAAVRAADRPTTAACCCSTTGAGRCAGSRPASWATPATRSTGVGSRSGRRRAERDARRRVGGDARPPARRRGRGRRRRCPAGRRRPRHTSCPRSTRRARRRRRADRRRVGRPMTVVTDVPNPAAARDTAASWPVRLRRLPRHARRAGPRVRGDRRLRRPRGPRRRRAPPARPSTASAPPRSVHLQLVGLSTLLVIVLAVPAGILVTRPGARRLTPVVVGLGNLGQTVPSLGVIVLFAILFAPGFRGAVVALVVYALPADPAQHHRRPAADRPVRRGVGPRHGHVEPAGPARDRAAARGAGDPRGDPHGGRDQRRDGHDRRAHQRRGPRAPSSTAASCRAAPR